MNFVKNSFYLLILISKPHTYTFNYFGGFLPSFLVINLKLTDAESTENEHPLQKY